MRLAAFGERMNAAVNRPCNRPASRRTLQRHQTVRLVTSEDVHDTSAVTRGGRRPPGREPGQNSRAGTSAMRTVSRNRRPFRIRFRYCPPISRGWRFS